MTGYGDGEHDNARRFCDAALPYLADVFTLARYLMRMLLMPKTPCRNTICERHVRSGCCVDRLYRSGEVAALGVKLVVRFAWRVQ
jgi:hypothetical protein